MFRTAVHTTLLITASALIFGLSPDTAEGQLLCRAKFLNSYPYGGAITSIYAEFKYSDGSLSTQGPNSVNLGYGEAGYLYSRDNTSCVKRVFQACLYEVGGQAYPLSVDSGEAPDGQCWVETLLEVVPVALVSEEASRATDPKKRFANAFRVYVTGPDGTRKEAKFEVHDSWDVLVKARAEANKK